jgi:hypothetical protein
MGNYFHPERDIVCHALKEPEIWTSIQNQGLLTGPYGLKFP